VEGTITAVIRGFTGIFDALTFFAPPYDQPLMEPEYAINRADEELEDYLW